MAVERDWSDSLSSYTNISLQKTHWKVRGILITLHFDT